MEYFFPNHFKLWGANAEFQSRTIAIADAASERLGVDTDPRRRRLHGRHI